MIRASVVFTMLLLSGAALRAQATYAGNGPGTLLTVGVTASGFQSDYGQRLLGGVTVYLDANVYRRIGVEAEARELRFHSDENLRETNYLVGPKISALGRTWRPYAKLLVGRGELNFPFSVAHGSYFVIAPGAGLDWRIGERGRMLVRLIDIEYQEWPSFTYGTLHPFGASAGISFRIFQPRGE